VAISTPLLADRQGASRSGLPMARESSRFIREGKTNLVRVDASSGKVLIHQWQSRPAYIHSLSGRVKGGGDHFHTHQHWRCLSFDGISSDKTASVDLHLKIAVE